MLYVAIWYVSIRPVVMWVKFFLHRQVAGACEYGNELWGSIKCGEFLD